MARLKKQKENHATKVTEKPKTKRQKYGMNETKEFSEDSFFRPEFLAEEQMASASEG